MAKVAITGKKHKQNPTP